MKKDEIPMGFGIALAMDPQAMRVFSSLPEDRQREIINGTHSVSSKAEMRQYVERISHINKL
ncbi:MAG: hypothetical protein ACI4XF_08610 [Oscillospiraceae bacterium]